MKRTESVDMNVLYTILGNVYGQNVNYRTYIKMRN